MLQPYTRPQPSVAGGEGPFIPDGAPPPVDDLPQGLRSIQDTFHSYEAKETNLTQPLLDARYAHERNMRDFPSLLGIPVEGNLVEECLKQLREKGLLDDEGCLRKKERGADESALYPPLQKVFSIICSEFNKSKPAEIAGGFDGTAHPRAYQLEYHIRDTNSTKLRDYPPSLLQDPDLCLVVGPKEESLPEEGDKNPLSWHDVVIPIEIKKTSMDVDLQSAMQALTLHTVQESRIFSYSMTIAYPMCQAHLWDRSGHISSPSFDITKERGLKRLVALMGRFSTMTLKDHGFDPTAFSMQDRKPHPPLRLPIYIRHKQSDIYQLDQRVTPSSDLFGKETRCWNSTKCSLDSSDLIPTTTRSIVKESWLHDERTDSTPPVQRLPNQDLDIPFTLQAARDDEGWSEAGLRVKQGVLSANVSFADGYEAGIYDYLQQEPIQGLAQFLGAEKLESTFRDIRKSWGGHEHLSRTRHRVILGTVGKPLREVSSPTVLLKAIRDIADGLEGLCRRGILHRDISDTNCLMDCTTFQGFLTDLDHAIGVNRLQELVDQGRRHRTGTLTFMATGVLMPFPEHHNWAHDLESVFWLLLWICAGSPVYGRGKLQKEDPNCKVLDIFFQQDELSAFCFKRPFLYDYFGLPDETITHPYFKSLAPCLSELRSLFRCSRLPIDDKRRQALNRKVFRDVLTRWISLLANEAFPKDGPPDGGRYRPPMKYLGINHTPRTTVTPSKSQQSNTLDAPPDSPTKRRPTGGSDAGESTKRPRGEQW